MRGTTALRREVPEILFYHDKNRGQRLLHHCPRVRDKRIQRDLGVGGRLARKLRLVLHTNGDERDVLRDHTPSGHIPRMSAATDTREERHRSVRDLILNSSDKVIRSNDVLDRRKDTGLLEGLAHHPENLSGERGPISYGNVLLDLEEVEDIDRLVINQLFTVHTASESYRLVVDHEDRTST